MIKAVTDNVIVKELAKEERISKGGIFIPLTAAKEEPHKIGRVISVGPKVSNISPGDIVVFAKFGGQVFLLEDEEYRVLKEPEIYCIIQENK